MPGRRRRPGPLFGVLAAAVIAAGWPAGHARAADVPAAEAEEDLIVEVRVDQLVLAEAIGARRLAGDLAVPLGEFARALDLAIEVDDAAGTAKGFLLREDRTFRLDAARGEAWVRGERAPYDPALVAREPDGLYVTLRQLERWLPVTLRYDPFGLSIEVAPHEPLPAQARAAREQLAEGLALGPKDAPSRFPTVATPYAALGDLAIDPMLNLGLGRGPDGLPRPTFAYAGTASTDLAWLGTTWSASGNQDVPLADFRFTLARKDADGRALGPTGAREVALGTVYDTGLPLVAGAWSGNGALVSSFPLNQLQRFDRHSFRGRLLPGWDAQLFRNAYPVGYQAAPIEGEYRFDDVPLVVGLNEFRVVLNGPQGQRRVEQHRFNVGATLAPAGEHRYRAMRGLERDGPRTVVQYDVGLAPALTASAAAAELPAYGAVRRYGLAGLRGYRGEVFWHATAVGDPAGGAGAELGLQAPLGPLGVTARHAALHDLVAATLPAGRPLLGRSTLRLDLATPSELPAQLLNIATAQVDWPAAGQAAPQLAHQLSARVGGLTASHQLVVLEAGGGAPPAGTVEVGGQVGPVGLRGQATYVPGELRALAAGSNGRLPADFGYNAIAAYQLATGQPTLALDLNRAVGGFVVGLAGSWAPPEAVTVGTTFSMGLVLPWEAGRPEMRAQGLANGGNVVVRCFLDADRDGRWDEGERALPDVELDLGGDFQARTDRAGRALFPALAAFQAVDLDFKNVAFDEPLWQPAKAGVRFVPRPGRTTVVDLPIVATGEVYGTITLRERAGVREFGGVRVEVVDAAGRVVATAISALDGYYSLTGLAPGRYLVRVDPAQAARMRLAAPPPKAVEVPGEGAVLDGIDAELGAPNDHE